MSQLRCDPENGGCGTVFAPDAQHCPHCQRPVTFDDSSGEPATATHVTGAELVDNVDDEDESVPFVGRGGRRTRRPAIEDAELPEN